MSFKIDVVKKDNFYELWGSIPPYDLFFYLYVYALDAEKVLKLYNFSHEIQSNLERLGEIILHDVDATKMEKHHIISKTRFDRIVYNFPHAGFHGKEHDKTVIK
jgi:25S rRNA (uracil2634-N3)-methyltransferase